MWLCEKVLKKQKKKKSGGFCHSSLSCRNGKGRKNNNNKRQKLNSKRIKEILSTFASVLRWEAKEVQRQFSNQGGMVLVMVLTLDSKKSVRSEAIMPTHR